MSKIIVRNVTVILSLVGMAAINATGCAFYGDKNVVTAMPRPTVASEKIHFFKPGRFISTGKFDDEHAKHELVPANPYTLAAFVSANQEFVDDHLLGTQWLDENKNACCVTFSKLNGKRRVYISRSDEDWDDDWWFVGVSGLKAFVS